MFAIAFALLATELFEATDGFGVMSNAYDPADYIANAAGVALAAVVVCKHELSAVSCRLPVGFVVDPTTI